MVTLLVQRPTYSRRSCNRDTEGLTWVPTLYGYTSSTTVYKRDVRRDEAGAGSSKAGQDRAVYVTRNAIEDDGMF